MKYIKSGIKFTQQEVQNYLHFLNTVYLGTPVELSILIRDLQGIFTLSIQEASFVAEFWMDLNMENYFIRTEI